MTRISHEEARHALMELVDVDKAEHVSVLQRFLMQQQDREAELVRSVNAYRCGAVTHAGGARIRCYKPRGHDMGHDFSGAPEPEPPADPEPQPWYARCCTCHGTRNHRQSIGRDGRGNLIKCDDSWHDSETQAPPDPVSAAPEPQPPAAKCDVCGGDGYYKGPRLGDEPCPTCKGSGKQPPAAAEQWDSPGYIFLPHETGPAKQWDSQRAAEPTPPDAVEQREHTGDALGNTSGVRDDFTGETLYVDRCEHTSATAGTRCTKPLGHTGAHRVRRPEIFIEESEEPTPPDAVDQRWRPNGEHPLDRLASVGAYSLLSDANHDNIGKYRETELSKRNVVDLLLSAAWDLARRVDELERKGKRCDEPNPTAADIDALRDQLRAAQAEVARLTAENEALRREVEDVRFLDEWALGGRRWSCWRAPKFAIVAIQLMGEGNKFDGAMPAAARRAAVEFLKKESGK